MTNRIDLPSVLLVDKPEGPTSHDVVQAVRRALGVRRVGHTGTLDPFATGLLILCVGRATRLVEYFHSLSKTYSAVAVLGVSTDTDDPTGKVTARSDGWKTLAREDIERAFGRLSGEQVQVPPAYSAKKVDGRRAYDSARAGESVSLAPQTVRIHRIIATGIELPEIGFEAEVSTGTYVRALARDLGIELGCHAHLRSLRRTSIGPFSVCDAAQLSDVDGGALPPGSRLSAARALSWLPVRNLDPSEVEAVEHGRAIADARGSSDMESPVAMVSGDRLVAVGRRSAGELRPEKVFHD
ncbi:MAG: tRNA pseudouridine(55) synthase TruB [Gemmatimonadota bacterium]